MRKLKSFEYLCHLYNGSLLSGHFQDFFSLSFIFGNLIRMFLGMNFFWFILPGVHSASRIGRFISLPHLGDSLPLFFQVFFFQQHTPFPPSWGLMMQICDHLLLSYKLPKLS